MCICIGLCVSVGLRVSLIIVVVDVVAVQLINDYESDQEIRQIADQYDWYILPVLNPDGYEYSHVRVSMI